MGNRIESGAEVEGDRDRCRGIGEAKKEIGETEDRGALKETG